MGWEVDVSYKDRMICEVEHYADCYIVSKLNEVDDHCKDITAEALSSFLEMLGRLVRAGIPVKDSASLIDPSGEEVTMCMRDLCPDELCNATDALIELREQTDMNYEDVDEEKHLEICSKKAEDLFYIRDKWENCSKGAWLMAPGIDIYTKEQQESIDYFDNTILPIIWKFTFANDKRGAYVRQIAPHHRPTYWWWCEADDIRYDSVFFIDQIATLISRYPTYRKLLQEHVDYTEWFEGMIMGRTMNKS